MKNISFFIFLVVLQTVSLNCNKTENEITDITLEDWKLVSLQLNSDTFRPEVEQLLRDNAYVLRFINDVELRLDTSVNLTKGSYSIEGEDQISFIDYQELTEVYDGGSNNRMINNILLTQLGNIESYEVKDRNLVLNGVGIRIEFRLN